MLRGLALFLPLVVCSIVAASPHDDQPKKDQLEDWIVDMTQSTAPVALALPDLDPASATAGPVASELSRVLFDDISFASAFKVVDPSEHMLARRAARDDGFYYGWGSIGADIVVTGVLAKPGDELVVEIQIHAVREEELLFESRYEGGRASARELAHYVADSILQKFGIVGIARTNIAFASDRAGGNKALWVADYDGFRHRQATRNHHFDFQPRYRPDGASMSYISFPVKNHPPVLAILNGEPVYDEPGMIFSASWSPDGTEIAFAATRDEPGNAEIYVMERDGTNVRRLTHHPAIDVSPTWSPTGRRLAFTSDRTGSPQVYTMDAEGLDLKRISMRGSYNAEPAWSPIASVNEIAYASRVSGGVFDIVVHSLVTNEIRVLTSNQGMNESPQWSPNGRHLVITSTRTGTPQIFTVNRDGSNPKQVTFEGENTTPTWSPIPRN